MARIEVIPAALDATSATQSELSGRAYELAGGLETTGAAAAGVAGEAEAAARSDASASWAMALGMFADSVVGLAGNLETAASAYTGTLAAADERLASPLASIGYLALGLILLYGAYAAWTGRWRSWAGSVPDVNVPLTIFPFMGWALAGGGLYSLVPGIATALLAAPAVLFMALFPFMPLDFDWFGPRWYRDFKRARRERERAERARRKRPPASEAPGVGRAP